MSEKRRSTGRFLVLEGPDGSGKSTQARNLADRLRDEGREILHVRDPGGTEIGEKIRGILLDRANECLVPEAEALLFMASRAQLVRERIRPALEEGRIVVCERWIPSTVCYQGYAGGLSVESIWRAGELAAGETVPDLTLVLDVEPEVGLGRLTGEPDLMERRSLEFHGRVRDGYLRLVEEGRMCSRLVSQGDIEQVGGRIRELVAHVL